MDLIVNFYFRLLATVSVVTVILVSLLVWSSILMDDFKHAKPFDGLSFNSKNKTVQLFVVSRNNFNNFQVNRI